MLITEHPYNGRNDRIRHYSDADMLILQNETGVKYAEAVDVYPCQYTYTETDEPVVPPEPEPEDRVSDLEGGMNTLLGSDSE